MCARSSQLILRDPASRSRIDTPAWHLGIESGVSQVSLEMSNMGSLHQKEKIVR